MHKDTVPSRVKEGGVSLESLFTYREQPASWFLALVDIDDVRTHSFLLLGFLKLHISVSFVTI